MAVKGDKPKRKKAKKRLGRPCLLTDEVERTICEAVKDGLSFEIAAACAGISRSTFDSWRKAAREGTAYGQVSRARMRLFWANLNRALAEFEREIVADWKDQTPDDWKAGQALLAVRFPDRWAKRSVLDVNVEGVVPVKVWTPRADVAGLQEDE